MVFLVWGDSLLWYLLVGPCAEESSMFGYSIAGLSGTGFSTLVTGLVFMWQQDIIWQNRSSLHGLRYNFDYIHVLVCGAPGSQFSWTYWPLTLLVLPSFNIRPDQPGIQGLEWPPLSWASFLMLLASAGKYCWILSKSIELISRRFLERIDTFILWLPILTVTEMLWFPADMVLVSFWLW